MGNYPISLAKSILNIIYQHTPLYIDLFLLKEPKFGKCYYLNKVGAAYSDASSFCTTNGGRLMMIKSDAERDYLKAQYSAAAGVNLYVSLTIYGKISLSCHYYLCVFP